MTGRSAVVFVCLLACGTAGPKDQAAPRGPTGDVVVVADKGALWAVPLSGPPAKLADVDTSWCAADARAGVVWVHGDRELRYYDAAGDGAMHVAVAGLPEDWPDIVIDHGADGRIGGESAVDLRIGLQLTVAASPSVASIIGCEGDAHWYCYGDDPQGDDPPLLPELAAERDAIDKLAVADPKAIAALAARRASRPAGVRKAEGDAAPAVAVDRVACYEDPDSCGEAQALPGTAFHIVIVGNSRGDFYHVDRQLYDPERKEFFNARDPSQRSPTPLADTPDIEDLLVAASGAGWAIGNAVVSAADRRVVWSGTDDARVCGWLGPAWRVPGPSDDY